MPKLNALLIDDDYKFCETFKILSDNYFNLTITHNSRDGLRALKNRLPDVVLLDLKLGRSLNGLQILQQIKGMHPDLPVIMITDFADVATAVEAMKLGALHYTSKSPNIETLKLIIERQMEQTTWKMLYKEQCEREFHTMVAEAPSMKKVLRDIEKVAQTNATVLIEGESGVGKEIAAREIHRRSKSKDNPFVAVNCSSLSPQLFESEFFGHEKGSFTGAHEQTKGKLELANNGAIFLDEIGELPIESQAKILRAIEDRTFLRLGGTETLSVQVRIIAATNKKLIDLVAQKRFREDLYYRLNVVTITIPPLRERIEDIPILTDIYLKHFANAAKRPALQFDEAALKKIHSFHWPGNIRELRNFIERLTVMHQNNEIIGGDEIFLPNASHNAAYPAWLFDRPYEDAKHELLNDFRKVYFQRALEKYSNNISETANALGINRSSFHRMLKELELK
ncbi:MAG: sigma-54-dependent transcriptional regulator [Candidatus Zhuqueibacterota bacterium]